MNLYNELIKSEKKTASIMITIYNDDYVMYPMGRSQDNKWVGEHKLKCFKTGKIEDFDQENFYDNIIDFLDKAINYDKIGLDISTDEDFGTTMYTKAKKNKFIGYKMVSVHLDFREERKLNIRRHRRISVTEWGASDKDSILLDDNCSKEELMKSLSVQISLANSDIVKK